jgi:hypothetical protein
VSRDPVEAVPLNLGRPRLGPTLSRDASGLRRQSDSGRRSPGERTASWPGVHCPTLQQGRRRLLRLLRATGVRGTRASAASTSGSVRPRIARGDNVRALTPIRRTRPSCHSSVTPRRGGPGSLDAAPRAGHELLATFVDSLKLLTIEHGLRIGLQQKTRDELLEATSGATTGARCAFRADGKTATPGG